MPIQIIGTNLYSVAELAQKLNVTTVTIRNYLKQGKLKGKKVMGRWLVLEEDTTQLFREIIRERVIRCVGVDIDD